MTRIAAATDQACGSSPLSDALGEIVARNRAPFHCLWRIILASPESRPVTFMEFQQSMTDEFAQDVKHRRDSLRIAFVYVSRMYVDGMPRPDHWLKDIVS